MDIKKGTIVYVWNSSYDGWRGHYIVGTYNGKSKDGYFINELSLPYQHISIENPLVLKNEICDSPKEMVEKYQEDLDNIDKLDSIKPNT